MAYGIEIYDSSGNKTLEMTDTVTRHIHTSLATATNDGTASITVSVPSKCSLNIEVVSIALEQGKMPHDTNGPFSITKNISGDLTRTTQNIVVTWTAQSMTNGTSTFQSSDSLILVFMR